MFRNYQFSQIKENIKKWVFERVDFFISSISYVSIIIPVLILLSTLGITLWPLSSNDKKIAIENTSIFLTGLYIFIVFILFNLLISLKENMSTYHGENRLFQISDDGSSSYRRVCQEVNGSQKFIASVELLREKDIKGISKEIYASLIALVALLSANEITNSEAAGYIAYICILTAMHLYNHFYLKALNKKESIVIDDYLYISWCLLIDLLSPAFLFVLYLNSNIPCYLVVCVTIIIILTVITICSHVKKVRKTTFIQFLNDIVSRSR